MPEVFKVPIRPDIVSKIHKLLSLSKRQPHGVDPHAGEKTSAESWGTGRALSRIPRVKGGGTMRAGQAAFGNMCRGGRMFGVKKIWRRWQRKTNLNEKRYATCTALAATGVSGLVVARGHRIQNIPELPLVLSDTIQSLQKTKEAVQLLKKIGAYEDIQKVLDSRSTKAGKGKMRNRRYTQRRGPLIVYHEDNGIKRAFRNIPGVELCQVKYLNLLTLAPGSHLGRFVIWTKSAFQHLNEVFGTYSEPSKIKSAFRLPKPIMDNIDLERIIQSDEIQSVAQDKAYGYEIFATKRKTRLLDDENIMLELNPSEKKIREKRAKHESESQRREEELKQAFAENMKLLNAE